MSANGETLAPETSEVVDKGKGKGKAVDKPDLMEEDEDSDEESGPEEVSAPTTTGFIWLLTMLCSNPRLKKKVNYACSVAASFDAREVCFLC